jgi:hypothetical protein
MKFSEAMTELKTGKRVARSKWAQGLADRMYLSVDKITGKSRAYRPTIRIYSYDSSIFMCDGWFILGDDKEYFFHEIVDKLYNGSKARLKEWGEWYIYYDKEQKDLVYHYMQEFSFSPEFKDLLADDWVVVE